MADIEACSGNMTGCFGCAIAGGATCGDELAACTGSQECIDFNDALGDCPSN